MFWDLFSIMHLEAFQLPSFFFFMHICIKVGHVVFSNWSSSGIQGSATLNVKCLVQNCTLLASEHIGAHSTSTTSKMNSIISRSRCGKGWMWNFYLLIKIL